MEMENEMLETTNETENVETETTEEITEEGIELTDTTEVEEANETETTEEKEEVKKTLRELLKENPDYQEEFEGMLKHRLNRKDREYQKELSKYKDTENVLRTTLNVSEDEDVNQKLRESYEADGVKLPSRYEPGLSSREIELLAKGEADDIINEGYNSAEAEANRLASKHYENLNEREKIVFNTLVEFLNSENDKKEIKSLGVKEDILSNKSFNDFRKKFNPNVPIKEIYEMYSKNQPKPKVENPGSMKNTNSSNDVKEFYTPEEASKFTRADYDKNPKLLEAVENSMTLWGKKY